MKTILTLFFSIIFINSLFAQDLTQFQNITYVDKISCFEEINSQQIYMGSEGGIVNYNHENGDYSIINASQNILDLNITSIEKINDEISVAGTYSGKLYLINNNTNKAIYQYNDIDDNVIVDIFHNNDTLWVATREFISVFKVIDNTLQFADLFENFPVSIDQFTKVAVFNNKLFVGAGNVLMKVKADYGLYNLKDENLWEIISINGTENSIINDLFANEQKLYIAGSLGLYSFIEYNGGDSLELIYNGNVRKAKTIGNILYWAYSNRVYKLEDGNVELVMTSGSTVYDFILSGLDILSLTPHHGIYIQEGDSLLRKRFSLFPSNIVGEVVANGSGSYYLTNSPLPLNKNDGCYKWDGQRSIQYEWDSNTDIRWDRTNNVRNIKEIFPGQFLMCSWGGGFWIVDENEDKYYIMNTLEGEFEFAIKEFDGNDYSTSQIPNDKIESLPNVLTDCDGSSNYCIVSYAIVDNYNSYLWLSQFASNEDLIAVGYPITNNQIMWEDSNSVIKLYAPGSLSNAVNTLEVDQWGNLWIGTTNTGCAIINIPNLLNGTTQWSFLNETDNLTSNDVRYITTDKDGYVWIGTASGINVWTGSELYAGRGYSQPVGLTVQYIHVDEVGNRWFATDKGISMLKYFATPWNSDNDWVHYLSNAAYDDDPERPGVYYTNLPNSEFKSVMVDETSGQLIVGSYAGLLTSSKATVLPAYDKKEEVAAFPNPVKFGEKHQAVYFKNVQAGANIKIFTVTGELIRELSFTNSSDFEGFWGKWDGKDTAGNNVNTGVYIYSAYTEDGNTKSGKIFVIKEN